MRSPVFYFFCSTFATDFEKTAKKRPINKQKKLVIIVHKSMTFYTIHIETAECLGLMGSDAQVYFALAYLAKHEAWRGSYRELARLSRCGCANTAMRSVQRLIQRGLVLQNGANTLQIVAQKLQNGAILKESNKENNNNIKKNSLSVSEQRDRADGQTDLLFETFWNNYAVVGGMRKYKTACRKVWQKLPEAWRCLAAERAKEHDPERNPYWWLKDEDFLRIDGGKSSSVASEKPHWLSGVEQDDCLRGGIAMAVCRNPETGLFGTVTKSDAEKFGLEVKRIM